MTDHDTPSPPRAEITDSSGDDAGSRRNATTQEAANQGDAKGQSTALPLGPAEGAAQPPPFCNVDIAGGERA